MSTTLIAGGGSGGHLIPALNIAAALRDTGRRVVLIGAERGLEAERLPKQDFPYHLLPSEPIYRKQWWKNWKWPGLALRLIRGADRILAEEKPSLVIGTGGYAAGPVVWRATRKGIPTAILEQDAWPGLTTRWLARRVRNVYLGQPEIEARLAVGKHTKVFVTGCPIVPPDFSLRETAHEQLGFDRSMTTLLITGGGQGSLALNKVVAAWLQGSAPRDIQVIWATGHKSHPEFAHLHAAPRIQVVSFLDPIAPAYAVADIAVTRSGMMTISELCAWGIPALLVPLPTAAADHQTRNAEVMAQAGAAIHVPQSDLTVERLDREVAELVRNRARRDQLAAVARGRARPGATAGIVALLEALEAAG
ncbi:MAG TPA: UDP-N-acetylglucosamine--N-acetylmuramyl-(pentapeptide) pyrophosphoryl-undecaprenol N-acetylglucosamine transferase [Gemmatimonadales bacterium]|nr:UDP-N-acetylglucosamine--N-acetylmuramyl-(pentapeptide) pyrophosphoryl-undecaprenol N-acetylglucosamine transferase [Gemmatimonadales bacterium]